jgi:hypothetical protein
MRRGECDADTPHTSSRDRMRRFCTPFLTPRCTRLCSSSSSFSVRAMTRLPFLWKPKCKSSSKAANI